MDYEYVMDRVGITPNSHRVRQRITHAKVTVHQNGFHVQYVYGCVHTEVHVCHYDRSWVPTPNVRWHTRCG